MDYKLQQFDLLKTVGKGNFCFNENVLLIFLFLRNVRKCLSEFTQTQQNIPRHEDPFTAGNHQAGPGGAREEREEHPAAAQPSLPPLPDLVLQGQKLHLPHISLRQWW